MTTANIQCGAAISTDANSRQAVQQACESAMSQVGGQSPDLAVVFASPHHGKAMADVVSLVRQTTGARTLTGCTGESIIGGGLEVEQQPALSVWLARLPDVEVTPFHLRFERTLDGGSFLGWPDVLMDMGSNRSPDLFHGGAMLLLGDPFSFPADALLERINEDQPGLPVFGGMASGAASPGENRLILNDDVLEDGAAAVLIHGPVRVRGVTSQGCRPIGTHFVITKADRNVIYELGGAPAMVRLKEIFQTLPARDQQLVNGGLHVGRVMSEYQDTFEQGDFLIKNVIGIDPEAGAIAIGDYVRVGQTVQFHVRDEDSADAELQSLLAKAKGDVDAPAGALLFTCNGRGTRLFSTPHHDAEAVQSHFSQETPIPLAGFFAAGEIGPVGGKNHIHGFTASIALFS